MDQLDAYNVLQANIAQNNAWSAEQAQKQMDFQERMANTAHQREIEDLKAAGLNPVLSAHTNGASVPSGAMAQSAQGGINAVADLLSKMIDGQTAIGIANATNGANAYYDYTHTKNKNDPTIPKGNYSIDAKGAANVGGDFFTGLFGMTPREAAYYLGKMIRDGADADKVEAGKTGYLQVDPNTGKPIDLGGITITTKAGYDAQKQWFKGIGDWINTQAKKVATTAYNATHATDHKHGYWIDDKGRMYDSYRVGTHWVEK